MTRLIVLAILYLIGWRAYTHFDEKRQANIASTAREAWSPTPSSRPAAVSASFKCDGRAAPVTGSLPLELAVPTPC